MRVLLFFLILSSLNACKKADNVNVTYLISGASNGFTLNYLDGSGVLVKNQKVQTQNEADKWQYSFSAEEGGIVFVSAIQKNHESGLTIKIILNGKVFKQGSSYQDTLNFVTVSGSIPFD